MLKIIASIFIAAPLGVWFYTVVKGIGVDGYTFPLFSGLIITFFLFKTTGDFLKNFLADAARYYDPSPTNVDNRDQIRMHGVQLLEKLTDSNKYDRIVVLSHSLGSVVGYDILRLYWAKHCKYYNLFNSDNPQSELGADALDECLVGEKDIEKYQGVQSQHFDFLKGCDLDDNTDLQPWLISDFISVGSPLSKIRLFSADGSKDVEWEKIHERTILTNPPARDYVTNKFVYERTDGNYKLHHGALFAFTRWTNIYFPGDWIGGEISDIIGRGTHNVQLKYTRSELNVEEGNSKRENIIIYLIKRFSIHLPHMHTKYWAIDPERSHKNEDRMTRPLIVEKFKRNISFSSMDEIYKAMHFNNIPTVDCDEKSEAESE